MSDLKRPQFIRKYDFIHYFTWSEEQWLWNSQNLKQYIESNTNISNTDDDIDVDEYVNEFDSKELIDSFKSDGEELDVSDPKVYEGNLIDQKVRKFIAQSDQFKQCKVFDFDIIFKNKHDLLAQAAYTNEILHKNDNIILFQPVFIYKNVAVAKPDVLIKRDNEFYLIEVKGTTKPKLAHVVDMLYQHHIITPFLLNEFNKKIDHYFLCVVAYDRCPKKQINFILTPYGVDTKNGYSNNNRKEVTDEDEQNIRIGKERGILLIDMINGTAECKKNNAYMQVVQKFTDQYEFDRVIQILNSHQMVEKPSLLPQVNYANKIQNFDFMKLLKAYWRETPSMFPMNYSGKIISYVLQYEAFGKHIPDLFQLNQFVLASNSLNKTAGNLYHALKGENGFDKFEFGTIAKEKTKKIFKSIKSKRVYFDFESINPAVRVIDGTLPCQQIITQVSVIKEENNEFSESVNIVIDPTKITSDDFKQIIDAIYPSNDADQYSYIVYNKTFEQTHLIKMISMINDPIYTEKINCIVANIFDLADFFSPYMSCIVFEELYGYFSIKLVLEVIQNHYPDFYQKAKCKDYHKLPGIHNGSEALNATSQRFFGLIDDKQWDEIVSNLKIYCENDVRAMIAVYFLVEHLCNTTFLKKNK